MSPRFEKAYFCTPQARPICFWSPVAGTEMVSSPGRSAGLVVKAQGWRPLREEATKAGFREDGEGTWNRCREGFCSSVPSPASATRRRRGRGSPEALCGEPVVAHCRGTQRDAPAPPTSCPVWGGCPRSAACNSFLLPAFRDGRRSAGHTPVPSCPVGGGVCGVSASPSLVRRGGRARPGAARISSCANA